jgi:hypothetical protein
LTAAAPLPWWRRPVRTRDLFVVLAGTALVWLALTLMLLIALREQLRERLHDPDGDPWQVAVSLQDLPIAFNLPPGLQADARLAQRVAAQLQLRPQLAVPVNQRLPVRLGPPESGDRGDSTAGAALPARARIDTVVDVDTRFQVRQVIDVDTLLDAQVQLVSWLAPFPVQVPLRLAVPVDVEVPVRARLPVRIDAPLVARLQGPLDVPVRTVLQVRPQVQAQLDVQVLGRTGFRVLAPAPQLQARLVQADLRVGRGDVRIGWREAPQARPAPAPAPAPVPR